MISEAEVSAPDDVKDVYIHRKRAATGHQADWRAEARTAFDFNSGDQWSAEDLAKMDEGNRPYVTFNRIAPVIDSIVGYEIDNRREVAYLSRTIDDEPVAGAFTDMGKFVRDKCDAEDEESQAYSDAVVCGMGWTETLVDYDDDPDGQIRIARVPPLEMRWDTEARANNLADANWKLREKWWPLEEVQERWPDKADDIEPEKDSFSESDWGEEHDATNAWQYRENTADYWDPDKREVLIMQYQWRERVDVFMVPNPDAPGAFLEFNEERYEKLKPVIGDVGERVKKWGYYQKIVAGHVLLEETEVTTPGGFSFQAITGKRDEKRGTWYGLVRQMLDPQKWANVFFSQAMFSFQTSSKGGVMAEEGVVDNKRDFEDKWASADSVLWVEDGALSGGRIQPKEFGGYPNSLDKLMQFAIQAIRDCTGVNLEMLGMVGHEQAGMLEIERKKSALTILAPLVNSLKRYRKRQGRILLTLMAEMYTPQQVSRITNRQVPFWTDESVRKFDLVVDDAPTSPNLKHETWQAMQQMLPAAMRAGMPIPPSVIKYSPLPDQAADEWIQYIDQQKGEDPEQMKQAITQLQQQLEAAQKQIAGTQEKVQVAQITAQTKQQELAVEEMYQQRRLAMEERSREREIMYKVAKDRADIEVRNADIDNRYDAELERIEKQFDAAQLNARTMLITSREQNDSAEYIARLKASADIRKTREAAQRQSSAGAITNERST